MTCEHEDALRARGWVFNTICKRWEHPKVPGVELSGGIEWISEYHFIDRLDATGPDPWVALMRMGELLREHATEIASALSGLEENS